MKYDRRIFQNCQLFLARHSLSLRVLFPTRVFPRASCDNMFFEWRLFVVIYKLLKSILEDDREFDMSPHINEESAIKNNGCFSGNRKI